MSAFGNQGRYYRPSMFGGFSFFPPVIKGLLIGNGIVFLLLQLLKGFTLNGFALYPILNSWFALMPLGNGFMPWQLVTYQFMHWDFLHLLFNMVFGVWMFGMEVEHMWGSKKFLTYYITCGVVAGLSQLLLSPIFEQGIAPTVGASGAVYGVMVAFASMFPDRLIYFYFLIPVRVKYFVIFLIVLGVFSVGGPSNVANLAHLGGALAGYIYILFDRHRRGGGPSFSDIRDRMSSMYSARKVEDVTDAKVYDIHTRDERPTSRPANEGQAKIDEILDKISRSGYQSLTEEEKKILFDASKRMN